MAPCVGQVTFLRGSLSITKCPVAAVVGAHLPQSARRVVCRAHAGDANEGHSQVPKRRALGQSALAAAVALSLLQAPTAKAFDTTGYTGNKAADRTGYTVVADSQLTGGVEAANGAGEGNGRFFLTGADESTPLLGQDDIQDAISRASENFRNSRNVVPEEAPSLPKVSPPEAEAKQPLDSGKSIQNAVSRAAQRIRNAVPKSTPKPQEAESPQFYDAGEVTSAQVPEATESGTTQLHGETIEEAVLRASEQIRSLVPREASEVAKPSPSQAPRDVENAAKKVPEALDSAASQLLDTTSKAKGLVEEVSPNQALETLKSAPSQVKGASEGASSKSEDILDKAAPKPSQALEGASSKAKDALDNAAPKPSEVKGALDDARSKAKDSLEDVAPKPSQTLERASSKAKDTLDNVVPNPAQVKGALENATSKAKDIYDNAAPDTSQIKGALEDATSKAKGILNKTAPISSQVKGTKEDASSKAKDILDNAAPKPSQVKGALEGASSKAKDILESAAPKVEVPQALKDASGKVKGAVGGATSKAQDLLEDATETAQQVLEGASSRAEKVLPGVAPKLERFVAGAGSEVKQGLDKLISLATKNPAITAGLVGVALGFPIVNYVVGKSDVTPREALKLLQESGSVLLDIRSKQEITRSGSPSLQELGLKLIRVPATVEMEGKILEAEDFTSKVAEVEELQAGGPVLVIMDRSGDEAYNLVKNLKVGPFGKVAVVRGGADAWRRSGLPWRKPKKIFTLDLETVRDTVSTIEDDPNFLRGTLGAAAAATASLVLFSDADLALELIGSATVIQIFAKKLLLAEDRKKTLSQIQTYLNTKVMPQELKDEMEGMDRSLVSRASVNHLSEEDQDSGDTLVKLGHRTADVSKESPANVSKESPAEVSKDTRAEFSKETPAEVSAPHADVSTPPPAAVSTVPPADLIAEQSVLDIAPVPDATAPTENGAKEEDVPAPLVLNVQETEGSGIDGGTGPAEEKQEMPVEEAAEEALPAVSQTEDVGEAEKAGQVVAEMEPEEERKGPEEEATAEPAEEWAAPVVAQQAEEEWEQKPEEESLAVAQWPEEEVEVGEAAPFAKQEPEEESVPVSIPEVQKPDEEAIRAKQETDGLADIAPEEAVIEETEPKAEVRAWWSWPLLERKAGEKQKPEEESKPEEELEPQAELKPAEEARPQAGVEPVEDEAERRAIATAAVQEALSPETATKEEPPQEKTPVEDGKENITLYYESGWESAYLMCSINNQPWIPHPGMKLENKDKEKNLKVVVVKASELEFVLTDGKGDWDSPPTGRNYRITGPGKYKLSRGKVKEVGAVEPAAV